LVIIWLLACLREAPPAKALCGGQALRRRQVLDYWLFGALLQEIYFGDLLLNMLRLVQKLCMKGGGSL
jgi:hypothetical protein